MLDYLYTSTTLFWEGIGATPVYAHQLATRSNPFWETAGVGRHPLLVSVVASRRIGHGLQDGGHLVYSHKPVHQIRLGIEPNHHPLRHEPIAVCLSH